MKKVLMLLLLLMLFPKELFGLNVKTHRDINKRVVTVTTPSGFNFYTYLINQLGFSKGKDEELSQKKTVQQWLEDGGEYEDEPPWTLPYLRSKNHFHNPINDQGFSGIWDTGFLSGDSAIVWALKDKGTQTPGGYYSWFDVRDYFYKALTSTDKTTRDTNFAETFRGLGQLMHLIQDASVPAHARNDFHYFYNYEDYAGSFVKGGGVPTPSSSSFFTGAISTIASFIDTNQYNGTNPAATLLSSVGLSEYSNANFFSEDTLC